VEFLDAATKEDVGRVIDANRAALESIPNFLAAEPGFPLVDGRILTEPAIIVFVAAQDTKESRPEVGHPSSSIGPYRVVLMQADPLMQLSLIPGFAPDGQHLSLTYKPLEDNPINELFEVRAPMLCHVSPDAGWPTLSDFLGATEQTLTVAMYDFSAEYIAEVFTASVLKHGSKVVMTWDDGMTQDETTLLANLRHDLTTHFECWEVHCGSNRRFNSAYHTKVAVRDSTSFWLSSGNWSKNSQPKIDPVTNPDQRKGMFTDRNRDWHIVVDDEPLAQLFERYIIYDRDGSVREAEESVPQISELIAQQALPDLFVSADVFVDREASRTVPDPIPSERLPSSPRGVRIQPVLTPDNYQPRLMDLLKAAKHSIDIQIPYIRYTEEPEDADFIALLELLKELSHQPAITLRIIVSKGNAKDLCRLVAFGVDKTVFKEQSNVHNKGIIVDREIVLVSSANWSSDGVLRNRDAGLIIYDDEIAAYYQRAFEYDWMVRASAYIEPDPSVILAPEGTPTPHGMKRVAWHDFYD
jgi:hypothetical protein